MVAEKSDIPAGSQRLIYSGKVLKDTETVTSYKVQNGHIHLVKSAAAATSTAAATTAAAPQQSTANQLSSTPANASVPSNIAAAKVHSTH